MSNRIYMDHAATTPVKPQVFQAMKPYLEELYGNPSSAYQFSGEIHQSVEQARKQIADFLGAEEKEIFFTSGGSESDNWTIKGVADALQEKGRHIITTKIEHHAVLHTCEYLEKRGFEVTYLDVDDQGRVNPADVEKAIRPDTILISVMYANNEIGTVEPIAEIGEIAHKHNVLLHTDAVQAFGHLEIDVKKEHIDLLSASAHKVNGPKGIGLLYIRKGVKITNLIHGGAQEQGRRAGTTNAAGIVGFAKAVALARENMAADNAKVTELRNHMIDRIQKEIPYVKLNGSLEHRLANNVNFSFRFIEGESLLLLLDQKGICASSGSACTSGSLDPSHVLLAIGLPHEIAHGSVRMTLGEENTKEEVDYAVDALKNIVERLRSMSPLYEDFVKKEAAK